MKSFQQLKEVMPNEGQIDGHIGPGGVLINSEPR